MIDLDDLSVDQQHQIVAQAMRNENILLKVAPVVIYPEFKDETFVSDLIQQYKQGSVKQTTVNNKRTIAHVSPTNKDRVTAATYKITNNSYVDCRIPFDASAVNLEMRNHIVTYQGTNNKHTEQTATGVEHHNPDVNKKLGNSKLNSEETHMLVTPGGHQKWINIKNSSVFDNPQQCLHTRMNWYNISITTKDVQKISHISSLNKHGELAQDIQDFCQSQRITLVIGDKYFANLLDWREQ